MRVYRRKRKNSDTGEVVASGMWYVDWQDVLNGLRHQKWSAGKNKRVAEHYGRNLEALASRRAERAVLPRLAGLIKALEQVQPHVTNAHDLIAELRQLAMDDLLPVSNAA